MTKDDVWIANDSLKGHTIIACCYIDLVRVLSRPYLVNGCFMSQKNYSSLISHRIVVLDFDSVIMLVPHLVTAIDWFYTPIEHRSSLKTRT